MKSMLCMLPTIPASDEERERLRPIGRQNEHTQIMIDQVRKIALLADQAGVGALGQAALPLRAPLQRPARNWQSAAGLRHTAALGCGSCSDLNPGAAQSAERPRTMRVPGA